MNKKYGEQTSRNCIYDKAQEAVNIDLVPIHIFFLKSS